MHVYIYIYRERESYIVYLPLNYGILGVASSYWGFIWVCWVYGRCIIYSISYPMEAKNQLRRLGVLARGDSIILHYRWDMGPLQQLVKCGPHLLVDLHHQAEIENHLGELNQAFDGIWVGIPGDSSIKSSNAWEHIRKDRKLWENIRKACCLEICLRIYDIWVKTQ